MRFWRDFFAHFGHLFWQGLPRPPQRCPMASQGHPRGAPGRPKATPEVPQGVPRPPQTCPRASQGRPRGAPGRPRVAQGRPRQPQRRPRTSQDEILGVQGTSLGKWGIPKVVPPLYEEGPPGAASGWRLEFSRDSVPCENCEPLQWFGYIWLPQKGVFLIFWVPFLARPPKAAPEALQDVPKPA